MPLLWISMAFLFGLLLGKLTTLPVWAWILALLAAALLAAAEKYLLVFQPFAARWRRWSPLAAGVLLVAFSIGGLRFSLVLGALTPEELAWYNDREPVRVAARLVLPPESISGKQRLTVEVVKGLDGLPESLNGRAYVYVSPGRTWRFGDQVEILGTPTTPKDFAGFAYRDYLNRKNIKSIFYYPRLYWLGNDAGFTVMNPIYDLRNRVYHTINAIFPQPEAGLMSGILLGLDDDIPEDLVNAFRATGTAHIVAISGFNIAILVELFTGLAMRVVRRLWAPLLAAGAIVFYTLLVGAQPSVVRAAVMGVVGLFGQMLGRRQAGVNSLALTAALMSLFNPWLPWDIGFQLSFTATLGLTWFADPFQQGFRRLVEGRLPESWAGWIVKPVSEYILFTLAAQVASFPISAVHFGRLSVTSLLSNLLILPPQPLIMILGGLTAVTGVIFPPLGQLLGWLMWPLPAYTTRAAALLAQLPGELKTGGFSWASVCLYYAGMTFLVVKGRTLLQRWRAVLPNTVLVVLALAALSTWRMALARPDGRLQITAFNLENGPAVLMRMPDGQSLLLGGSSESSELAAAIEPFLPPGRRSLDALLLEGAQAKSSFALEPILRSYQISQVWIGSPGKTITAERLKEDILDQQLASIQLEPGHQAVLPEGVEIEVLDVTTTGAVLMVKMDRLRVIYAPAAVKDPPAALLDFWSSSTPGVLVGGPELAGQAPPGWITVSSSAENSLLAGDNRQVDLGKYSWVTITSDGQQLWAAGQN